MYLSWAAYQGQLSADPLSTYRNETGVWALRFICVTLLLTPLRRLTKLNLVSSFRRMMGLYAFFYGSLHFVTYVVLDRYAGLIDYPGGYFSAATMRKLAASIADDVVKRPYITMGFIAFVLMVPLAVTSTTGWIRRMGGKKWAALHRLIYVTAIAGVIHYWWLVKADISRPETYAAIVAILLAVRIWYKVRLKADTTVRRSAPPSASARDPQSARG
ncbi:MAG TPA: protein-methionine-sulfoxide reductase heme-binding subunit MsrQ [Vicinamibacterales bacterium]|nr:protein-methionine-sulfoxide reductase heme-binding subunit MsrQ [Vicinamibacterales bacterium]